MKFLTKKNAALVLQLLTVAGILIGMGAGFCLLWEITDIYMLNGVLYTMQPEEQIRVLREAFDELRDDGIEYGLVAAAALAVSAISSMASFILTCLIKTSPQQTTKEI